MYRVKDRVSVLTHDCARYVSGTVKMVKNRGYGVYYGVILDSNGELVQVESDHIKPLVADGVEYRDISDPLV